MPGFLGADTGCVLPDVLAELKDVLDGLTDTKESREAAKIWFLQRAYFGSAMARAMHDRVLELGRDVERQLQILAVVSEILHDSLEHRSSPSGLDDEALAFLPVLGTMFAAVHEHHHNREVYEEEVRMLLQEVYKVDNFTALKAVMETQPAPSGSESSVGLKPPADSRDASQALKELKVEHKALEREHHYAENVQTSSAIQTVLWAENTVEEIRSLQRHVQEKERMNAQLCDQLERVRKQLCDVQNEDAARRRSWIAERLALKKDIKEHMEELKELKENLETEKQKNLCKICYDMPRDSIILACSHFDYCFKCLERHKKALEMQSGSTTTNTCPTCRAQIQGVLQLW